MSYSKFLSSEETLSDKKVTWIQVMMTFVIPRRALSELE